MVVSAADKTAPGGLGERRDLKQTSLKLEITLGSDLF